MTKHPETYMHGDNLEPTTFEAWWGVFNSELSVRGMEHATYGLARDHFKSGGTPSDAADWCAKWVDADEKVG